MPRKKVKKKKKAKAQSVKVKRRKKIKAATPDLGGRPTKYRVSLNDLVYKLCLLGATDENIAECLNIAESTLNDWKHKHLGFSEAIKKGKLQADGCVAQALFHRACGYTHPEVKVFCNDGDIVTYDTFKHYPPDTGACFIWLKNRAGWKDKQEHEHGIAKETIDLLRMIDGTSKGKLPDKSEEKNAG